MQILTIVHHLSDCPFNFPGIEVVAARSYLTDPKYSEIRGAKIFNLCRSLRYQSIGYYVSLLAAARGHKPLPSNTTIQDMKSPSMVRMVNADLYEMIQKSLASLHSDSFTLSIYFGKNVSSKYDRLSGHLFQLFPGPLLRAQFSKNNNQKWSLHNIGAIAPHDIPPDHVDFVNEAAAEYFAGKKISIPRKSNFAYYLAILINPDEAEPPSDKKALKNFIKASEQMGIGAELITKEDYGRIAEFDALFIRETTGVNHHTYRFARRAAAEDLVVIDDPESILKCTNKVYLAELLQRYKIRTPRTIIGHRDNVDKIGPTLGFPCILKKPDSSFSQGVVKVTSELELEEAAELILNRSDLFIAQEYLFTDYDWRVGVLNREPIFACKYFMARNHWQVVDRDGQGKVSYGNVESIPVEETPAEVIKTALKAANLIGKGLYGVDLKLHNKKAYVIEINDNPNIDSGSEDAILKENLYSRIMEVFWERIEKKKERPTLN